jgi:hypothetical protein
MSARTGRLYRRLDELEAEFRTLLQKELKAELSGGHSRYLCRKYPHLFEGRFWRNAGAAHLERLEKDIVRLREKLGEPLTASAVGIVLEYARVAPALKVTSGELKHLLKQLLGRLGGM